MTKLSRTQSSGSQVHPWGKKHGWQAMGRNGTGPVSDVQVGDIIVDIAGQKVRSCSIF